MTSWYRLGFLLLGIVAVNVVTWVVLLNNQRDHLYPPDADSLSIPLFETARLSTVALPAILLVAVLPWWVSHRKMAKSAGRYVLTALIVLSYLFGGLFALYGLFGWFMPHHYGIALAYGLFLLMLVTLLIKDWKGNAI